jgi:photosystem II stability/assembly factor-like uncharacterized protein
MQQQNTMQNIFRKLALVSLISVAVLGTAASCSLNPFAPQESSSSVFGMLKQDPSIKQDTFGKINNVKAINGKVDSEGLTGLSVTKIKQINSKILFALTVEKGVYKTSDAGKSWERIYIYPVNFTTDKDKQKELEAQLKKNDDLQVTNFWVSENEENKQELIYFAVRENKTGKIFKTENGGRDVKEVHSEINQETSVDFVVIDPQSDDHVYALLDRNALIQTLDGGKTWQKLNDYTNAKDKIMQIGILPGSNTFFIFYEKIGLFTSEDGQKWKKQPISKTAEDASVEKSDDTAVEKVQRRVAPKTLPAFKQYQRIIPVDVGEGDPKPAIMLADKEIWFTQDLAEGKFIQIKNLPVQSDKIVIQDVAVDPELGIQKIYVATGSRLLVSENAGETWANKQIGVNGIGTISRVVIDKENPEVIYLAVRK